MRDLNNTGIAIAAINSFASKLVLEIAERICEKIVDAWSGGKDALGRAWAELSPSTIEQKGHSRKLFESGDLVGSNYAERTGPFSASFGFSDFKAGIHEFGVPELNIPARPFLGPGVQWAERQSLIEDVGDDLFDDVLATLDTL